MDSGLEIRPVRGLACGVALSGVERAETSDKPNRDGFNAGDSANTAATTKLRCHDDGEGSSRSSA